MLNYGVKEMVFLCNPEMRQLANYPLYLMMTTCMYVSIKALLSQLFPCLPA